MTGPVYHCRYDTHACKVRGSSHRCYFRYSHFTLCLHLVWTYFWIDTSEEVSWYCINVLSLCMPVVCVCCVPFNCFTTSFCKEIFFYLGCSNYYTETDNTMRCIKTTITTSSKSLKVTFYIFLWPLNFARCSKLSQQWKKREKTLSLSLTPTLHDF